MLQALTDSSSLNDQSFLFYHKCLHQLYLLHNCELWLYTHTCILFIITRPQTAALDGSHEALSLRPPNTRSVHVQTDYRDSEAQTDPYTPEYVVQPGSVPELLTLANLCHGKD